MNGKVGKTDPEYELLPQAERDRWEQEQWEFYRWSKIWYSIRRGTEKEEIRLCWQTFESTARFGQSDVLAELGRDGWELCSKTIESTAIAPEAQVAQGWDTASIPTRILWTFKRPLAD
jgi:hypothetical protein